MLKVSLLPMVGLVLAACASAPAGVPSLGAADYAAILSDPARAEADKKDDAARRPAEVLAFAGIRPGATILEMEVGRGWYTEILAPFTKDKGRLIVAAPEGRATEGITKFLASNHDVYGKVEKVNFPSLLGGTGVAAGTADAVVTFRNVHNWRMGSYKPDNADYSVEAFKELYAMLKPGGVLGIEDHRLPEGASEERERQSGYLKASTVRRLAEQAGFKFAGSSEINANPKDTKDYPKGVWTLPPRLAEGDTDRAKYLAIGESDRMTLKFVKPAR